MIGRWEKQAQVLGAAIRSGFAAMTVDDEIGTITWPSGADLAPDTLYHHVSTGMWPEQNAAG